MMLDSHHQLEPVHVNSKDVKSSAASTGIACLLVLKRMLQKLQTQKDDCSQLYVLFNYDVVQSRV